MNQLPLFPPSVNKPTSIAAAEAIMHDAATLRAKVYEYLRVQPDGATDEELSTALQMNPSSCRPRRVELVARNLVTDSGKTRKTVSGRSAIVWTAVGQ